MPPREGVGIVVIVSERSDSTEILALRAWLRNERRLGIQHVGVPIAAPAAPPSAPTSKSRPTASSAAERAPLPPTRSAGLFSDEPAAPPPVSSAPAEIVDDETLGPPCEVELPEAEARLALKVLDETHVHGCTRCGLHGGRTQTVFGVGRARPELVFVGEGPGADEDRQGEPFVGRAGQLLTRMIAAMTLTRDQVYICNVVKCRPPGNRTPSDQEMATCSPLLFRQLAILRPKIIVALGRPAAQTLLATKAPIGRLRGQFHDFPPPGLQHVNLPPAKLMPTFHPAYLLRSPDEKGKAWADLQQVMKALGIAMPGK